MKHLCLAAFLFMALALFSSGCSSITNHGNHSLYVTSNPSGAKLTVYDRIGNVVASERTPALVHLKPSFGYFDPATYRLVFEYPGYYPSQITVGPHVEKWYLGNAVFGYGLGFLVVDPVTGAMWNFPRTLNRNLISAGERLSSHDLEIAEIAANPESPEPGILP